MNTMSGGQFLAMLVLLALFSAVCTVIGHATEVILRRYLLIERIGLREYTEELVLVRNAAINLMVDAIPEEPTSSRIRTVTVDRVNALGKAISGLMNFEEIHGSVVSDFVT